MAAGSRLGKCADIYSVPTYVPTLPQFSRMNSELVLTDKGTPSPLYRVLRCAYHQPFVPPHESISACKIHRHRFVASRPQQAQPDGRQPASDGLLHRQMRILALGHHPHPSICHPSSPLAGGLLGGLLQHPGPKALVRPQHGIEGPPLPRSCHASCTSFSCTAPPASWLARALSCGRPKRIGGLWWGETCQLGGWMGGC